MFANRVFGYCSNQTILRALVILKNNNVVQESLGSLAKLEAICATLLLQPVKSWSVIKFGDWATRKREQLNLWPEVLCRAELNHHIHQQSMRKLLAARSSLQKSWLRNTSNKALDFRKCDLHHGGFHVHFPSSPQVFPWQLVSQMHV